MDIVDKFSDLVSEVSKRLLNAKLRSNKKFSVENSFSARFFRII